MKILYITAVSGTMGFFVDIIKDLVVNEHDSVDIACNCKCSLPLSPVYNELGSKVYDLSCSRNLSLSSVRKTVNEIKEIIRANDYDIVHCHTPIAAVCTRIACKSFRKKGLKVIYTAHGFHFYKGAPLKNWLIYYPAEWICAFWTDVLITINKEDYRLAKKHMHAKRIEYVPGVGIDLAKFSSGMSDEQKQAKRKELGIPEDVKLVLSVGDLNVNKNHETVIRAISQLEDKSVHYAIAGTGVLREYLESMINELGMQSRVHLLGFRDDIADLYKATDICAFPSIREGLGLAAIEGMASGLPLICADNRGTRDYAVDGENAIVCRYNDVDQFARALETLLQNDELRTRLGQSGAEKAKMYDYKNITSIIKKIYLEIC